ncbi:hypothetical protein IEQ34_015118 [Dendrobium chrysotoxum]|uniref:Uncharacterized protein n=1 Tax=Dendrobium chrysotoxum TaxID=161865 RepID=A0AAV7GL41_DENCH|nr:hypothetical protein IEQ34_015011 [Dendrobium chrysotoxum]KAH0457211.1 hypothetical protein IEQ34_015118 [Dendrobium chrysotoxum]
MAFMEKSSTSSGPRSKSDNELDQHLKLFQTFKSLAFNDANKFFYLTWVSKIVMKYEADFLLCPVMHLIMSAPRRKKFIRGLRDQL